MPHSTLAYRMAGRTPRTETKANCHNLTELEQQVVVRYILDLDARGFAPRLAGVEDMANYILESRGGSVSGSSGHIDLYNVNQSQRRVLIAFTTLKGPYAKILSLLGHRLD
jgi:hypothetical protein